MTRSGWAVVLVSGPAVALAIAWLATLALASTGEHPIWNLQPRNLSEAAAFRDGGAIVRMVRRGHDPNASAEVRGGFVSSRPVVVTPLEAAVMARRDEIVRLLLELGAAPDAATWTTVWCEADDSGTRTLLESHRPDHAPAVCPEPQNYR